MSLRASAAGASTGDSVFAARGTTSFDVGPSGENATTRSIRLPAPAAELARELDDTDDEEIPEETLPAPVTHEDVASAHPNHLRLSTARTPPRTSARRDDRPRAAARGAAPAVRSARPWGTGSPALAHARRPPVRPRRHIVVLSVVAALATAIAVVVALFGALSGPVATPVPGQTGSAAAGSGEGSGTGQGGTNILLTLTDSPKDAADIAADGGAGILSIAVIDFSGDGSSVSSVSFRPDTWVAIPEHGEGTLSDALTRGGADALQATVQDSLGIRIDHTIVITEPWLTGLALSGDLDIVNPSDVVTDRFTFPNGPLTLSSSTAADYLKSDPRDVFRQQAVLDGAARLLISRGTPEGSTMDAGLAVLPTFSDDTLQRLTEQLRQVDASGIVYGVAATSDAERDSREVATLDGKAWRELRTAFDTDDVAGHLGSGTSR